MQNKNLAKAKAAKNDEFYTQLSDIEKELCHYRDSFRGKVVFCNCDDPEYSNFWKYFQMNFIFLGLKKLISTHYEPGGQSYKMEIVSADLPFGQIGIPDYVKTPLAGDGDFRSEECVEILKEADVVVTNRRSASSASLLLNWWNTVRNSSSLVIVTPLPIKKFFLY